MATNPGPLAMRTPRTLAGKSDTTAATGCSRATRRLSDREPVVRGTAAGAPAGRAA